ncbi:MAG: hypothetical protein M1833_000616 [Piccolia ochrophora]|nr:MAG: hypothetical protein M1833_000616 [Piccolia ochrophora]
MSRVPTKSHSSKSMTMSSSTPSSATSFFSRNREVRKRAEAQKMNGFSSESAQPSAGLRGDGPPHTSPKRSDSKSQPVESQRTAGTRKTSAFGFGISRSKKSLPESNAVESRTKEKPQRNILRRKPSSIDPRSAFTREDRQTSSKTSDQDTTHSYPFHESTSLPGGYNDPYPGAILGITLPPAVTSSSRIPSRGKERVHQSETVSSTHEVSTHWMPPKLSTHDLPPPTPLYAAHTSSSPSTRYSDSPGPFSRTSTPTSMSSHSPGTVLSAKVTTRPRPASPTKSRPPVTRMRAGSTAGDEAAGIVDVHGLPSVRESLNSSSSGSTVKAPVRFEKDRAADNSRRRLSPPPPSPPPRKSSTKFSKSRAAPDSSQIFAKPTKHGRALAPPAEIHSSSIESSKESSFPPLQDHTPRRPSRDGAPRLDDYDEESIPVIQSNLLGLRNASHKRQGSGDSVRLRATLRKKSVNHGSIPSSNRTLPGPSTSRIPSRNPSPSPAQLHNKCPQQPPMVDLGTSTTVEAKNKFVNKPPSHPSPSKGFSRFALFSRRPKTPKGPDEPEKQGKASKKGPAAGTGHEGYGKYSFRGRSGSTTSTSGSWARSASASTSGTGKHSMSSRKGSVTSKGESSMDEFFADRLEPKVIVGGRAHEESNASTDMFRSESNQSSLFGRPSTDSKESQSTQFSTYSKQESAVTSPSDLDHSIDERSVPTVATGGSTRRPSIDSESVSQVGKPSLAMRRSFHRSLLFSDKEPLRIPLPIKTNDAPPSPSGTSFDSEQYSPFPDDVSEGKEGNWLRPRKTEKLPLSPLNWNAVRESLDSPQSFNESPKVAEVQVTVARNHPGRPVAYYAMLDAGEQGSVEDLEKILDEAGQSNEERDVAEYSRSVSSGSQNRTSKHTQSVLLPDPPALPSNFQNPRPASPKVVLRTQEVCDAQSQPVRQPAPESRPPRPSRLQQVGRIPRVVSTRDRRPSPQSFSRPFLQNRPAISSGSSTELSLTSGHPPQTEEHNDSQGNGAVRGDTQMKTELTQPVGSNIAIPYCLSPLSAEEFLTFPTRKGSQLSGSSSSGPGSFAASTAVIPQRHAPPGEDEVWNEFDDLIDDVLSNGQLSPRSLSYSPTKKVDRSHHSQSKGDSSPGEEARVVTSPDNLHSRGGPTNALPRPKVASALSVTQSVEGNRKSRSFSSLHSTLISDTPVSFTDPFANSETATHAYSQPQISPLKTLPKTEGNGLDSEINIRFGALMTSRWLSFGRVLFSPAHAELKGLRVAQDRILVLDGLGNDDWSFYCALTYPDAIVYNLSPAQSNSSALKQNDKGAWQSPPNHRQIYHPSIENPFPFPKGFFTTVVLRFPVASSETAYQNVVSECKRVLRPGGYLEISILDLDMMNMGNRARRAVRTLKVRMQVADNTITLKPTSDNFLRLLGRRGFENVNRCTLGVPAAGNVGTSRNNSWDEQGVSLSELLRDNSSEGDEGITKMVAKVGRWWHTQCYEMGVLPEGDASGSIWNDRMLLGECERNKTSFKLLICYAQKPLAPRRRTVSV